jgi:ATP-dependent Clp protease ATP-binding subunit ClpB
VSRLIGAPPGYIGYEEAGLLTESVRRRPYQILLLDEFEKAHRDVWNILLQLFDEGHLTDSHSRTVDFRNVIVIMTSNLGAQIISELPNHMLGSEPEAYAAIMDVVRHTISPELLNRIDETVLFHRLQRENMDTIAGIGIAEIAKRLDDNQSMTLVVSDSAKDVISEQGYDVRYGARPLKRVLNRELLNPLSRLVLEGAVLDGDTVYVKTRAEAEIEQKQQQQQQQQEVIASTTIRVDGDAGQQSPPKSLGWISSNLSSHDKNDIVILRNHEPSPIEEEEEDRSMERELTLRDHENDVEERRLDDPQQWHVHK